MVYPISKYILWPFFSLFVKRIEGLENIPDKPCIYAINHASYFDGILIIMMLAWYRDQHVHTLATNELFRGHFWDFWFDHFGSIRVHHHAVEQGVAVLKKHPLAIFPEAGRSYDGSVAPVNHTGLGVLALLSKRSVVPIGINTFDFWNRYHFFPSFRRNVHIVIGKPLSFSGKPTKARARTVVNQVMSEVKHLARIAHAN